MYIWELPDWPRFRWDLARLAGPLSRVRYSQGLLAGRMAGLGFPLQEQASLETFTEDVLKSSEIEGEILDPNAVRSSVARHLGMEAAGLQPAERHIDGVVEMVLDATQNYAAPLSKERLFGWHAALFPTGYSGLRKIKVGGWREPASDPMRVESGSEGRPHIHFEAPPAARVEREMAAFLDWYNGNEPIDTIVKSGIAHLWFVTIHPFEDGNGRIARAIMDMTLTRGEQRALRFYSMSAELRRERKSYYGTLEATQRGMTMDVTERLLFIAAVLSAAVARAEETLGRVLQKASFWQAHTGAPLNERQRQVVNKLLDGLTGKLTTSKWAKLVKCSQDTAYRDILELVERGILEKGAEGGRSTNYTLILPNKDKLRSREV